MLRLILFFVLVFEPLIMYAQTFTGQVFHIDKVYLQDKCTVVSDGDCSADELFFLTDKQFCLIGRCIFNDVYYTGTYLITGRKIILTFRQTWVHEVSDTDMPKAEYKKENGKIENREYKIAACGQKVRLIDSKYGLNGFRMAQTEEQQKIKRLEKNTAWKLLQN